MTDTTRAHASGRFLLRLDPGLHAALREAARAAGCSLNELCARVLAAGGTLSASPGAAEVVRRAAEIAGGHLLGVVVFGSWARGESGPGSDLDVLVVVGSGLRLTRELYREWDGRPVRWEGLEVEPHFVHLPPPGAVVAGVWAEAAVDGIVLWDRAWVVSRRLVAVRHDILEGRVVRRLAHGHPYWTVAA